jgi:hypothetical protein
MGMRAFRHACTGVFYGLYLLVEEIDKTWLETQPLLKEDAMLLKAQHWKYSNLRAADPRLECPQTTPDQQYNPGPGHGKGVGCPVTYQVISPKVRMCACCVANAPAPA